MTHWLDGSNIYGSTKEEANGLRAVGGRFDNRYDDDGEVDEANGLKTGSISLLCLLVLVSSPLPS